MKQNNKIKFFVLGCFVFGFLSLGIFVKPSSVLAGSGTATRGQSCTTYIQAGLGTTTDTCQQGLNCINLTCVDPNLQITTTPPAATLPPAPATPSILNTPGPTPPTPCPTGLNPGPNGICLPPSEYTTGLAASTSLSGFIVSLIKILLTFAGMVAVVMLVIGGYWYMAAGGNEEMSEKGRKTILNFVMGLVIIILAYTIVSVIASTLTGADRLIQQ